MLTRLLRTLSQSPGGVLEMPVALDTVHANTTAIGSTLAAATIVSGDSFTVKNATLTSNIWLLQAWMDAQAAAELRIRSAKMHDNVDAIRTRVQTGVIKPLMPFGAPQRLYAQDTLIVEQAGSATAGDIESSALLIYYDDLPGQSARLQSFDQVKAKLKNLVGVRLSLTAGTSGGYSGAKALNADVDLLKANTDYALFGLSTDTEVTSVCLRGPDTGNLRVSVPGEPDLTEDTMQWFRLLSSAYNLALMPIINSANKGATLVDVVSDENAASPKVVVWLGELG
jgi:hypothetical protein